VAATPSVRILKTFPYRGTTKTYSNRYHFNGGTPADVAHWNALFDAIVLAEKAIYDNATTIVEAIGYAAGSEVPVATKSYTTVGTGAPTGGIPPGEVAALVRYATAARSSKNHPVYLFNYYHRMHNDSTLFDVINSVQKTLLQAYAAAWLSPGFSDGVNSYVRAGPNGATATGYLVESYLTHRDFPR
jgi:hypothetical protein